jgi:hypothetical protein
MLPAPDRIRKLILSVDYEIFGNGSGDVRQHVIEPVRQHAPRSPLFSDFDVRRWTLSVRRSFGCAAG